MPLPDSHLVDRKDIDSLAGNPRQVNQHLLNLVLAAPTPYNTQEVASESVPSPRVSVTNARERGGAVRFSSIPPRSESVASFYNYSRNIDPNDRAFWEDYPRHSAIRSGRSYNPPQAPEAPTRLFGLKHIFKFYFKYSDVEADRKFALVDWSDHLSDVYDKIVRVWNANLNSDEYDTNKALSETNIADTKIYKQLYELDIRFIFTPDHRLPTVSDVRLNRAFGSRFHYEHD
jgi:hypothetical protein